MTTGSESSNTRKPPPSESSANTGGRAPLPVQESNTTVVIPSTEPALIRADAIQISSDTSDTAPAKAPYHPSDIINANLLDEFPEAEVALVHDDDWMPILKPSDPIPPPANEFYSRVKAVYDPVCESGVAQLKPKESGEQSREGDN